MFGEGFLGFKSFFRVIYTLHLERTEEKSSIIYLFIYFTLYFSKILFNYLSTFTVLCAN